MKPVFFRPGETIYSKDDFSEGIYFITTGKVYFYLKVIDYRNNDEDVKEANYVPDKEKNNLIMFAGKSKKKDKTKGDIKDNPDNEATLSKTNSISMEKKMTLGSKPILHKKTQKYNI